MFSIFARYIPTFTPYQLWHHAHLIHHRTAGNLDNRGTGDVWTLTVEEYQQATPRKRFIYRVYRNPWIMFVLGAPLMFTRMNRFTRKDFSWRERRSVYLTNAGIALMATGISLLIGFKAYLMIQLPITYFASASGVFLFYVQVSFLMCIGTATRIGTTARQPFMERLISKIPNYKLARCRHENPQFGTINPATLGQSFKTLSLRLWDEKNRQLVTYRQAAINVK